ncbi:MAG: Na+/H+ antiporter NhaA [Proteobacteria bacterium]|nr:Na+/H+ antiporter NhaA [Pseudomonadota bacterium]
MITQALKNFFKLESSGGILLLLASVLAIIVVNSELDTLYYHILFTKLPLEISLFNVYKDLDIRAWINDGLMAIFFLLVGLELKREVIRGELSSKSKVILPIFAAIGGVVLPAVIYSNINSFNELNLKGWAIPTATDIAFAVGILGLFGKRIPNSLKVFLVALAIIDDLIAIIIIFLFYTENLHVIYLDLALFACTILFILNKLKVKSLTIYLSIGVILWVLILKSGIHATIAGVMLALFIPVSPKSKKHDSDSPLHKLENALYFPVSYIILPIFAFANAGVDFTSISYEILFHKVVLGIALGLFVGKQVGIVLSVFLLTKLKISPFFRGTTWLEFYGVSILAGIGFTMSLFIGGLAFKVNDHLTDEVIIGVMLGSLSSAIYALFIISYAIKKKAANQKQISHK